jgi:hypothetical protein
MSDLVVGRAYGVSRYPSNAAALPMPAGAKRAGELMQRDMQRKLRTGEAFDLLGRIARADSRGDFALVGMLIEEGRGLITETGGAL